MAVNIYTRLRTHLCRLYAWRVYTQSCNSRMKSPIWIDTNDVVSRTSIKRVQTYGCIQSSFDKSRTTFCQRRHNRFCSRLFKRKLNVNTEGFTRTFQQFYSTEQSYFTLANDSFRGFVESMVKEHESLLVQHESVAKRLSAEGYRRLKELKPVVDVYHDLKSKYEEVEELTKLLEDEEMREMAEEEKRSCLSDIKDLEEQLVELLSPPDAVDDSDIIVEVESGAGGQEAMLFAQEIFELYQAFAAFKGWVFDTISFDEVDNGGIRAASASISGQGVYQMMKLESGVHRVQRVPKTEKMGRTHTSTITVAIFPRPSEIEIVLNPNDIKMEAFRSSGPGGQNVQKVNSAVRLTHLPTGVVAECQQQRSQHKNKKIAMDVLRTRIYNIQIEEQRSKQITQRKIQVGGKDRSEKIRTYNFPQNRITDHRLGYNFSNIEMFMSDGVSLEKMIVQLLAKLKVEDLRGMISDYEDNKSKAEKASKSKR